MTNADLPQFRFTNLTVICRKLGRGMIQQSPCTDAWDDASAVACTVYTVQGCSLQGSILTDCVYTHPLLMYILYITFTGLDTRYCLRYGTRLLCYTITNYNILYCAIITIIQRLWVGPRKNIFYGTMEHTSFHTDMRH